ncbi:MAG: formaldehyde-activating enzyme [Methanobacteriaceae archaeon]|nr:formaldehyde-activating enzyme [Methanobacteriaceae archaeon]
MMYLAGEAVVGDGAEVSHIDLLIGDKEGAVGPAFANALANRVARYAHIFTVITPNLGG